MNVENYDINDRLFDPKNYYLDLDYIYVILKKYIKLG